MCKLRCRHDHASNLQAKPVSSRVMLVNAEWILQGQGVQQLDLTESRPEPHHAVAPGMSSTCKEGKNVTAMLAGHGQQQPSACHLLTAFNTDIVNVSRLPSTWACSRQR